MGWSMKKESPNEGEDIMIDALWTVNLGRRYLKMFKIRRKCCNMSQHKEIIHQHE